MAKQWISSAIKHPGALHKQMGVPEGQKIPKKRLAAAANAGGTLGRRARLAQTLATFHMPKGGTQAPKGDIGALRAKEAQAIGTFKGAKAATNKLK